MTLDPLIGEIVKAAANSGPAATIGDTWQVLVGDRIAAWRVRNAMAIQKEVFAEAQKHNLKLDRSKIPERFAVSWFEEATNASEPEIQVMFARLLTRAAVGDPEAADRRLIKIVGEMTPHDAAVFERIYSNAPFPGTGSYSDTPPITQTPMVEGEPRGWPRDWALALLERFHPNQAAKSVEQLILLGLLEVVSRVEPSRNSGSFAPPSAEKRAADEWRKFVKAQTSTRRYLLSTELGKSLYSAVGSVEPIGPL